MNPNNNINGNAPGMNSFGEPATTMPSEAPMRQGSDVVFRDKPKKNTGMILGMVLLALFAVCGIGFGVWAMLSGNAKEKSLNEQINSLKQENSELIGQVSELQTKVEEYENKNSGFYEIVPPKWGEAEVEVVENKFTVKTANGEIYLQDEEHPITEIVSCDSGTAEAPLPMTCTAKTLDGLDVKFIYDFDEQSLEYIDVAE